MCWRTGACAGILSLIAVSLAAQNAAAAGDHEHRARGAQRDSHSVSSPPHSEAAPVAPDSASRAAESGRVETWFGWQTLLADTASFGIMRSDDWRNIWYGLGAYVLGGPMVHLAHGRTDTAAVSAGVRLAAVTTASIIADNVSCRDYDNNGVDCSEKFTGVLIAILAAPIIDAAFLTGPDPLPAKERPPTATLQFGIAPTSDGALLSAAGTF